jgi:hypothetical protein
VFLPEVCVAQMLELLIASHSNSAHFFLSLVNNVHCLFSLLCAMQMLELMITCHNNIATCHLKSGRYADAAESGHTVSDVDSLTLEKPTLFYVANI